MAVLLLLLALATAACGGEAEPSAPSTGEGAPAEAQLAPDFSLTLDDGSTFVLSEATTPTYLVFWAEW